jgi:hypothetical protein
MGQSVREYLDSWQSGVLAANEVSWPPGAQGYIGVDQLTTTSSPRAWNNTFALIGDRAVPRKRDGCLEMNTAISGVPAIIGQYAYRFRDTTTGDVTQYHLLVGNNGGLYWMDESGAVTTISATQFSAGEFYPDFATLGNLAFIANGEERIKLYGTTVQTFGIERPDIGSASGNAGVPGNLNGVYEVRFAFRNSVTGHRSSASDSTAEITATNTVIDLTGIPQSSDSQVDTIDIAIRNIATQAEFYVIGDIAHGTTTATIDVDDNTTDVQLTELFPDTNENDPPVEGIKFLAAHKNRMFAADDGKLYWSKTGFPEAFDPEAYDLVNQDDGQKITGLVSIPGGYLIIFKEDSYYVLEGDTPSIWTIARLGPSVGCSAHTSIEIGADAVYWWAEQGPVKLTFGQLAVPELIGLNRISAAIGARLINVDERRRICAAFDLTNQRIFFSIPDARQHRNTRLLVWSSRLSCWESDRWDPIDAASLAVVNDSASQPFVMIGGYAGQVFKLGIGSHDAVASGTVTGTFVASSASHATITDLTASFASNLVERKVTVLDSLGNVMTPSRPRITANTGTVLTLSVPVSGLTAAATYTYTIGGPDWQFDTAWRDFDVPFDEKKLEFVYALVLLYGHSMFVDVLRNKKQSTLVHERFATLTGEGTLWNEEDWNTFNWNDANVTYAKERGGQTGVTFALRFRNPYPRQPQLLIRTGFRCELLNDKLD